MWEGDIHAKLHMVKWRVPCYGVKGGLVIKKIMDLMKTLMAKCLQVCWR